MPGTILILTNRFDPHADVMVQILNGRGINIVRLDPGDFPTLMTVSFFAGSGVWDGTMYLQSRKIDLMDVISVWHRRPSPMRIINSAETSEFVHRETRRVLEGLWSNLDTFWVNHPTKDRIASNKPYQLKMAQQVGLKIPKTIITNDPGDLLRFYDDCAQDIVFKTLSPRLISHQAVYTSIVEPEHMAVREHIRHSPGIFQQRIHKQFDVRTTIIGHHVFSAAIISGDTPYSQLDWRRDRTGNLRYEIYELPCKVEQACRQLLDELGLSYGALDLVVDQDGEHWFLEINPGGQFGFIEQHTRQPMFATLADLLTSGGTEL